ncbi:type VII secretion protein EccB [Streptomyces sp. P38-E01]|uniref:Type VII secretion protein EccB n=1 Tax=Streptomyces tardus TaxID=2780544 RepID=A0A949JUX0_9ACTN|nr:type VII secretion protein EccB [Streptomyces tardus]MBU7600550.1 type VII secretion protein EccB [Streptomyces tardus]
MASRRDELNAYTFEKKRTVAAFLQPSPSGSDEGAPKPIRGFLPGLIVGALLLVGFGAWGMFKPLAPKDWDTPKKNVIIGSDSTTRYVVLETDGKVQLHPVLNLASAKLLLTSDSFEIVKVAEKELDSGRIPHGPTVGIPYAPDRLPDEKEAGRAMRWAVCEKPGGVGRTPGQAAFVLGDHEHDAVEGKNRLRGGDVMYVRERGSRAEYLVDPKGKKYQLKDRQRELLNRAVTNGTPQPVDRNWLATLPTGDPLVFPELRGPIGAPAGVEGLDESANRIGMVLRARTADGYEHYLVEQGRVVPVTDFSAFMVLYHPATAELRQRAKPYEVNPQSITPVSRTLSPTADKDWPVHRTEQINRGERQTLCSVLRDVDGSKGTTTRSTWAAKDYPRTISDRSTSAYVTPGAGMLFRQFQGSDTGTGGTFLLTDTGLRYAVQSNNDSSTDGDPDGSKKDGKEQEQVNEAQMRLGYQNVKPLPVPIEWAQFLPTGPRLDVSGARLPQGS